MDDGEGFMQDRPTSTYGWMNGLRQERSVPSLATRSQGCVNLYPTSAAAPSSSSTFLGPTACADGEYPRAKLARKPLLGLARSCEAGWRRAFSLMQMGNPVALRKQRTSDNRSLPTLFIFIFTMLQGVE